MKGRQLLSTFGTFFVREPDQPTPLNPAWDSLIAHPASRRGLDIAMSAAPLDKGRLVCVRFGKGARVEGHLGKIMRVLRFSIGGKAKLKINGSPQNERDVYCLPNGANTVFETSDGVSLHLQMPAEALDRAAATTQGPLPDVEISPQAGRSLRDLAVTGARELEAVPLAFRASFGRNLERLLATRWAAAILAQLPDLRRPDLMIGRRKFDDLIAWARSDHDDPVGVAELARYCGLGIRALEKNFGRYLDVSPRVFLRDLRLEKVRALLLRGGCTVTEAAFQAGFVHLGHFASHYRHKFGEAPSATVKRPESEQH